MSSPRRILLKPGPCACTRGLPLYCSTVAVPPKIRLRRSCRAPRRRRRRGRGRSRSPRAACRPGRTLGHAVRRPRLLRARLEHQADLHRNDRQPQRVHAGRVRRQHHAEHRRLRLVADRHAALLAVAAREDVEIEPAREESRILSMLRARSVLLHVDRHMCSGRPVVADCMRTNWSGVCVPSPSGSSAFGVELAGLLHACEQVVDRDLAQHVARGLRVAHVALDQAAVGPADLGQHLAGREVDDLVHFQALVRLAPAEDGNVDHGVISLVVRSRDRKSSGYETCRSRSATRDSVHADRRRRRELAERPHAADAVPRILLVRRFALAFVALRGSRARRTPSSASSAARGRSRRSRRPCRSRRSRRPRPRPAAAARSRRSCTCRRGPTGSLRGQAHQRVAVGRRHVDAVEAALRARSGSTAASTRCRRRRCR